MFAAIKLGARPTGGKGKALQLFGPYHSPEEAVADLSQGEADDTPADPKGKAKADEASPSAPNTIMVFELANAATIDLNAPHIGGQIGGSKVTAS